MGAWAGYRRRRTHHYPDQSESSACWMCKVTHFWGGDFTAVSQQAGLKWTIRNKFSASDYKNNCFSDLLKHKNVIQLIIFLSSQVMQ